jgi:type III pantothenate kinase
MTDNPALLFDAGNSRLKWGVLNGTRISPSGSIDHDKLQASGFKSITSRLPRNASDVLISNVAGTSFATRLSAVIGIHCDAEIHFARSEKRAFGLTNAYRQPRRLGVDRWVAMIGARAEFSTAVCVVDAGTAITIDVVDRGGVHLGGQILPGLQMMMNALSDQTSDIGGGSHKITDPGRGMPMFAQGTRAAVNNGSLGATCGAIERSVRSMRAAGYRPKIVLTGGDASRILKQLEGTVIHRPNLVLQGLAFMLRNKS